MSHNRHNYVRYLVGLKDLTVVFPEIRPNIAVYSSAYSVLEYADTSTINRSDERCDGHVAE